MGYRLPGDRTPPINAAAGRKTWYRTARAMKTSVGSATLSTSFAGFKRT
jgi:hypothetical protein